MNQSKLQPALIGGAALAVASSIPYLKQANVACCALAIGGGVLAAYFYMREAPPSPKAPLGAGLLLGALAGVFGAIIQAIISVALALVSSDEGNEAGDAIMDSLRQADMPPEALEFFETLFSGEGLTLVLIGVLFTLVAYPIFAGIGAMTGVAIFNKKPPTT